MNLIESIRKSLCDFKVATQGLAGIVDISPRANRAMQELMSYQAALPEACKTHGAFMIRMRKSLADPVALICFMAHIKAADRPAAFFVTFNSEGAEISINTSVDIATLQAELIAKLAEALYADPPEVDYSWYG